MELHPLLIPPITFVALWLALQLGNRARRRQPRAEETVDEDFKVILGATLTMLALMIGFSFSMAINRYDDRKKLEEEEANAIGTQLLRADLLPRADAEKLRRELVEYIDLRIAYYVTRDDDELRSIGVRTARAQHALWSTVTAAASAQPTPLSALVVAGMNDVLNWQGYTDAAWHNRIPVTAWALMVVIALCSHLLLGYGSRTTRWNAKRFVVLPLVISIAFLLIADIDTPRRGLIAVTPENLRDLLDSLRAR